MASDSRLFLRLHADALNGQDLASLESFYPPTARIVKDGVFVGEGPRGLRLVEAALGEEAITRVVEVDGQPVLLAWTGPEGRRHPLGFATVKAQDGRVSEFRFDTDQARVQRLVARAKPEIN